MEGLLGAAGSPIPRKGGWEVAMQTGRRKRMGTQRERNAETVREKREEGGEYKMSGLYRQEPLAEGKPSPWAEKFRVKGRVCQVWTEGC